MQLDSGQRNNDVNLSRNASTLDAVKRTKRNPNTRPHLWKGYLEHLRKPVDHTCSLYISDLGPYLTYFSFCKHDTLVV